MAKIKLAVLLTLLAVSISAFAHDRDFQTGKLIDVGYNDLLHGGSSQRRALYQVRLGDVIYSAEGDKVKHNADPAHGLIVGDRVRVAIEGDRLFLRRPDGKDIKATIIKRQRAEGFFGRLFSRN
jgi:hypothetical protein